MSQFSESEIFSKIATGQAITEVNLSNCGLTEFPKILFKLKDSLEILNMGGNHLSSLPPAFAGFYKLRILFFAENDFETVPECLGALPSLFMLSFKGNKVSSVPAASLSPSLGWLILTDNKIAELPDSIGNLHGLRKCMLANNKLQSLPNSMTNCKNLELLRLSRNNISQFPSFLLQLPKLSWLSFAGNEAWANSTNELSPASTVTTTDLTIGNKIGEGASGLVYEATWSDQYTLKDNAPIGADGASFAYKVFKGQCTSDGHPDDEMRTCIAAGRHANVMSAVACVVDSSMSSLNYGSMAGLLFPLIPSTYSSLANPPSFESVTRDIYPSHSLFPLRHILTIVSGIASAMNYLHARGIIHGDLYGHNIHVDEYGNPLLMDFGASFVHPDVMSDEFVSLQLLEVRAFGCLLEELLQKVPALEFTSNRYEELSATLMFLCAACTSPEVAARPTFENICATLLQISL